NSLNGNEQYPNQQDNNQTNGENGMINNDNYPYAQ
ncbi:LytR family transcriptional regulator, partial [Staphylococcus capitis]